MPRRRLVEPRARRILAHEGRDQQRLGIGLRNAARLQVEHVVVVQVAGGGAVAAGHVIGIDLEFGLRIEFRRLGEQQRVGRLLAVGLLRDLPDDAFEKILGVNIIANHRLVNLVLPDMIEKKDGSIIVVSSVGGLRGHEKLGAYCISKAADLQLVRNLAMENGPHNIRVNAISPGLIRTDFARALWENPDLLAERTGTDPLRRIGEPEEIAGIAVYLASRAGSFTTGQNFVVDGGSTIS